MQHLDHNTELEGDSKREDLCQQASQRVIMTTTGTSGSGQLEVAGASSSKRSVGTDFPSTENGSSSTKTLMEKKKSTPRKPIILRRISSRRARKRTNFTIKYWTVFVQDLFKILPIPRFPTQRCDVEPMHERLLMGFILAYQRSRRLQKDGDEKKPRTQNFKKSVQRQMETMIELKDAHNMHVLHD